MVAAAPDMHCGDQPVFRFASCRLIFFKKEPGARKVSLCIRQSARTWSVWVRQENQILFVPAWKSASELVSLQNDGLSLFSLQK